MKRLLLAICLLSVAGLDSPLFAESLEQILKLHLDARGGEQKIRAIDTVRVEGTINQAGGETNPVTWLWRRPHSLRIETTVTGLKGVQTFDGKNGWLYLPFAGHNAPQAMPEEFERYLPDDADFEGPLVRAESKGNTVELVGQVTTGERPVWRLKVTRANLHESEIDLDASTYLPVRQLSTRTLATRELKVETLFSDYREVDGVQIAFRIETRAATLPGQTMIFESVAINPELDDSLFEKPVLGGREP